MPERGHLRSDAKSRGPPPIAILLTLALFVVLMGLTWPQHRDVGDAQVYQVVARNIVRSHSWTHLQYLPSVHPTFYEHLPFGFWAMAVTIKSFGEDGLIPLCSLLAIAVVCLAGWVTMRLAGAWAGLAALFILATTQKFFFQIAYPTLDPLLLLPATASAAIVLVSSGKIVNWVWAALALCLAVAIKGPFGAVPFASAVVARAWSEKKWSWIAQGVATGIAGALPIVIFVVSRPDWRENYGLRQIVDSLTGSRSDGVTGHLAAVRSLSERFWPWFPLVFLSIVMAVGYPRRWTAWLLAGTEDSQRVRKSAKLMLTTVVCGFAFLSLPGRHIWHHILVMFPLLSVLCGIAVGPLLERSFSSEHRRRSLIWFLAILGLASLALMVAGTGRLEVDPPCVISQELNQALQATHPGENVLVVSHHDEWDMISALAAEKDVTAWPSVKLEAPSSAKANFALIRADSWERQSQWIEINRARGWVLAKRQP